MSTDGAAATTPNLAPVNGRKAYEVAKQTLVLLQQAAQRLRAGFAVNEKLIYEATDALANGLRDLEEREELNLALLHEPGEWYVEQARDRYANRSDDDIEVDDDASFSASEDGVWVQGWLWVRHPEEDEDEEDD